MTTTKTKPKRKHWSDALRGMNACDEALEWCQKQPSLKEAWKQCNEDQWLLWLLGRTCQYRSVQHNKLVLCCCDIADLLMEERTVASEEGVGYFAWSYAVLACARVWAKQRRRSKTADYAMHEIMREDPSDDVGPDCPAAYAVRDIADMVRCDEREYLSDDACSCADYVVEAAMDAASGIDVDVRDKAAKKCRRKIVRIIKRYFPKEPRLS